ncbi:glycogen/starch synthase [Micromonospora sp. NPDC048170]|uniref:glycogen synthase n=1 Tax=Micromonospora sp. NPDC048170 TaxID=3154819 RepID=UPI0034011D1C
MSAGRPLRVFFATSEVAPLVKVGGLGDVARALPRALAGRGHDVRLFLPGYAGLPDGRRVGTVAVAAGASRAEFTVDDLGDHDGVRYLTLRTPQHPDWERPEGYVEKDLSSFVLFSRAVAELAVRSATPPDAVHCNDWHVGHVPAYLRTLDAAPRTVMTIHNLAYQGLFPHDKADELDLTRYGTGNLLAQGIRYADAVTTVSGRYRDETLAPAHGVGMQGLLRARGEDYHGILNGVDYDDFDPATDPHLPAPFDVRDLAGKAVAKRVLQRRSGLDTDPDVPLFAFVGRLVDQKGVDLLLEGIDEIAALGLQLVVVGVGAEYERAMHRAARYHPNVAYHPDSGEAVARLAYAGSDAFLAPSRFEPCGLAPLIALRYGSVPVVRRVGGMAETVAATGLGFSFDGYRAPDLVALLAEVVARRADRGTWARLRERGMRARFSWDEAAGRYEELYVRVPVGVGAPAQGTGREDDSGAGQPT